jgi:hypothetical protein
MLGGARQASPRNDPCSDDGDVRIARGLQEEHRHTVCLHPPLHHRSAEIVVAQRANKPSVA